MICILKCHVRMLLGCLILSTTAIGGKVRIHEILSSNGATLSDEDGDFEDWIELHNPGTEVVDLAGWGISDDPLAPFKWTFPGGSEVGAGEYLLVWASGKDRPKALPWAHTNFSLSSAGEPLLLTRPDGTLADSVPPVALPRDVSFGRSINGEGIWSYFDEPTPGLANTTTTWLGVLDPPEFSHGGGFHGSSFGLSLSAPETGPSADGVVVYWIDHMDEGGRVVYDGPIPIGPRTMVPSSGFLEDTGGHPDGPFHGTALGLGYRVPMPAPVAVLPEGDFSLEARFRTTNTGRNILMGNFGDGANALNLELHTDNRVRVYVQHSGVGTLDMNRPAGVVDTRDGRWHHLAAVRSGAQVRLYLNGTEVGTAGSFPATAYTLDGGAYYIGRDSRSGSTEFNGEIEDARLWNRALTAAEISEHVGGGSRAGSVGLVAEYSYPDEGVPVALSEIKTNSPSQGWRFPDGPQLKGTVVRARVERDGYLPSPVRTRTFWVDPQGASRYSLPVVSLAIDPDDFFSDDRGIYVYGNSSNGNYNQRGEEWERPVHIEYYHDDGSPGFAQNLGVRIHGAASRQMRLKSLRFYARRVYDDRSAIDHPVFPGLTRHPRDDVPFQSFERLMLRSGGTDWGTDYGGVNDSWGATGLRDLMQVVARRLPIDSQAAYQRVVVFLNGEYWGIQNFRERYSPAHFDLKFGVPRSELVILERNRTLYQGAAGDVAHYNAMVQLLRDGDPGDPALHEVVGGMMDYQNHILYSLTQIYLGNFDWPGNNIRFWRMRTPETASDAPHGHDGRWRWLLYDVDLATGSRGWGFGHNTLRHATATTNLTSYNPLWSTELLRLLLRSETYRRDFINAMADLLNEDFSEQQVGARVGELKREIEGEMPEQIRRWRGFNDSMARWENNMAGLAAFAANRPATLRGHFVSQFELDGIATVAAGAGAGGQLAVNSLVVKGESPRSLAYFQGVPITLRALPDPGYRFAGWDGLPADTPPEVEVDPGVATSVTALFELIPPGELPLAVHLWDFNSPAEGYAASHSLVPGAALVVIPGPSSVGLIHPSAAQGFDSPHLRINEPLGAVVEVALPTTGFSAPIFGFATRRSGQGAGVQKLEYTTNGSDWQLADRYFVDDAPPGTKQFDFTTAADSADNPAFAVRISFSRGVAQEIEGTGLTGNHRFDDLELSGTPLPGWSLPPEVIPDGIPADGMPLTAGGGAAVVGLETIFTDPAGMGLEFNVDSADHMVAMAGIDGGMLVLEGLAAGETMVTVSASDGKNPPVSTAFRVLVYPAPHLLADGNFTFGEWDSNTPAGGFPPHMIFLQSEQDDSTLATVLNRAYHIPAGDASAPEDVGFPYAATSRTRINGLGEDGVAFINSGRGRDLGGTLLALDTTGVDEARVGFTAGTLLENTRVYAIRLQYRIGTDGSFADLLDDSGSVVEYVRGMSGHQQMIGPVALPPELLGQSQLQLLWRYHLVSGTNGPRAWLRLDDVFVAAGAEPPVAPAGYQSWINGYFPAETDHTIIGPAADANGDGVANAIVFVLGGDPLHGFNQPLLPTVALVSDPGNGVPDGDYLVFRHRQSIAAAAESVTFVEYSPDLQDPWTVAADGVGGVVVMETPDAHAPGIARVETFIPISDSRTFARLRVIIP